MVFVASLFMLCAAASAAAATPLNTTVTRYMSMSLGLPPTPVITPQAEPTAGVFTCHMQYCDGSTSWCLFWGGLTTFDGRHGPVPGETRAPLGLCQPATLTLPVSQASAEPTSV